MKLYVIR